MRRLRGQYEDHFCEIQGFERFPRENEMTMVNGIETAAVDANLFQARLSKALLHARSLTLAQSRCKAGARLA